VLHNAAPSKNATASSMLAVFAAFPLLLWWVLISNARNFRDLTAIISLWPLTGMQA
jgi:hypothetical protein